MEIKITIPKELEQDAMDAFSYNDKDFLESGKTKKEWMLYLINRYIKEVVEDYIVNIKSMEQIRQAQENVKQQIKQGISNFEITTKGVDGNGKSA
jgi:predicted DNA-binding protein